MNKTVIFITFAALAALGLIGGLVLLVTRPDASATFTNLLVLVFGLVVTAAGTFAALGKQNEKIDKVVTQTNGINSALRTQLEEANTKIAELSRQLPPDEV